MGDEKYMVAIRKDVYNFINKIWYKHSKEYSVKKLLECWSDKNDDFKKELMSNLSPDDAVYIIDYMMKNN